MGILNWLFGKNKVVHTHLKGKEPEPKYDRMVGEPVTSFIASLAREPKRYKLERVLTLKEYPRYTCYNWMNKGAGAWKLIDRKTGNSYVAYSHEPDKIWKVYGLPFELNHWELVALHEAFMLFRIKARMHLAENYTKRCERERSRKSVQEKIDRLAFAKQFQEG